MANRRMINKSVVESDAFLDMPQTTQNLYFHLNIRADDDGFIDSPKTIMRTVGSNQNDLEILIAKRYLLAFQSGVIVIKHWKLHNTIRKDRYKPTLYQDEISSLFEKENGAYTDHTEALEGGTRPLLTNGKPAGNQTATSGMHRLSKVSLDKINIEKDREINTREREKNSPSPSFESYVPEKKENSPPNPEHFSQTPKLDKLITSAIEHWNTKNLTRCRDNVLTLKNINDVKPVFDKYSFDEIKATIDNLEKYYERDGNVSTVFSNFFCNSFERFSPDVVGLAERYETKDEKKEREDREYFNKIEEMRKNRGSEPVQNEESEKGFVPY